MNINTKLMIALGILCIFVIISGVWLMYTQAINEKLNVVTTTTTPLVETIDDMIIALLEMNLMIEEIIGENNQETLQSLTRHPKSIKKVFKRQKRLH